ncbi:MAG TPA: Na/Pi cotransporter family protein [Phycisphaerae bacterium]|nr:Na/Pi cotransporter family protein [Phycisphaerae bacterium]
MFTALLIAGGVALLVFATRFLREGLDRLFGARLAAWLQRTAKSPIRSFFAGLGVASLTPSSTTMSMLAVDAVQAGHVTTRQMVVIMLGADIGITITVQLIALSFDAYAPIIILAGVLLGMFASSRRTRGLGQVITALGLLFMGMHVIKEAVTGTAPNHDFLTLLEMARHYPVGLACLAAILAIVLQSSTATIGLVISIAAANAASHPGLQMDLPLALPVVLGANIGVGITTLIVGFARVESRRLGAVNLFAKTITASIVLGLLPQIIALLDNSPGTVVNHTANAHTGFNILKALLIFPFIGPLCVLVERLIPASPAGQKPAFGPRYIQNGPFDGATLAMAQSAREIMYAADIVRSMLEDLWRALKTNDEKLVRQISERDNQVDMLDAEVKKFLSRLSGAPMDADETQEQLRQLRYLAELESIGDIIDKNLCRLVLKKINLGIDFPADAWRELDDFDKKVLENMLLADTAFQTRDRDLAEKLLRHKDHIDLQIRQLRDAHFVALPGQTDIDYESGAIQLDLLTNLKRINSHVSHVAFAVIHGGNYTTATNPTPVT